MLLNIYTLPELVDLALRVPEKGSVNFNILHTVLQCVIDKAGLQGARPWCRIPNPTLAKAALAARKLMTEEEIIPKDDEQVEDEDFILRQVKLAVDALKAERAAEAEPPPKGVSVGERWLSFNIERRLEGAEGALEQLVSVIDCLADRVHQNEHSTKFKVPHPENEKETIEVDLVDMYGQLMAVDELYDKVKTDRKRIHYLDLKVKSLEEAHLNALEKKITSNAVKISKLEERLAKEESHIRELKHQIHALPKKMMQSAPVDDETPLLESEEETDSPDSEEAVAEEQSEDQPVVVQVEEDLLETDSTSSSESSKGKEEEMEEEPKEGREDEPEEPRQDEPEEGVPIESPRESVVEERLEPEKEPEESPAADEPSRVSEDEDLLESSEDETEPSRRRWPAYQKLKGLQSTRGTPQTTVFKADPDLQKKVDKLEKEMQDVLVEIEYGQDRLLNLQHKFEEFLRTFHNFEAELENIKKEDKFQEVTGRLEMLEDFKHQNEKLMELKSRGAKLGPLAREEFEIALDEMGEAVSRVAEKIRDQEQSTQNRIRQLEGELSLKATLETLEGNEMQSEQRLVVVMNQLDKMQQIVNQYFHPDSAAVTKCIACGREAGVAGRELLKSKHHLCTKRSNIRGADRRHDDLNKNSKRSISLSGVDPAVAFSEKERKDLPFTTMMQEILERRDGKKETEVESSAAKPDATNYEIFVSKRRQSDALVSVIDPMATRFSFQPLRYINQVMRSKDPPGRERNSRPLCIAAPIRRNISTRYQYGYQC